MSDLTGGGGELRIAVQVTRKETGKVEEYELVSVLTDDEAAKLGFKEKDDGSNP